MATSDEEENIYTKPGAIRRGGNSSTAVGFYSRGVQPTDVQTSDDYSPPSNPDPVVLPGTGESDDSNTDPDTDATGSTIDNPRFIDVDPTVQTLTRVASLAAPTPIGLAAGAVQAGINVNNLDWANAQRERLGLEKLGGWETVKAAAGFSDYTDGKVGTVDISGKQREVTYGGGLVGDGPDVEKRTSMTAAEALARQAAARSISRAGDDNSDPANGFGTRDDPRAGRSTNSSYGSISNGNSGSGGGNDRDPNSRDTPSGVSAAEAYGGLADSMRGSGNTNLSGGPSDRGGDGAGGGSNSGGCFFTTAVCQFYGMPDDCDVLETLREFRDQVLAKTEQGQGKIAEYYQKAPQIVQGIHAAGDGKRMFPVIFEEFILPCVDLIKSGEHAAAEARYSDLFHRLNKRYGGCDA